MVQDGIAIRIRREIQLGLENAGIPFSNASETVAALIQKGWAAARSGGLSGRDMRKQRKIISSKRLSLLPAMFPR